MCLCPSILTVEILTRDTGIVGVMGYSLFDFFTVIVGFFP